MIQYERSMLPQGETPNPVAIRWRLAEQLEHVSVGTGIW
jgi:hypothetical protein